MYQPVYKLQIVFADTPNGPHRSAVLPAGGTQEADLVRLIVAEIGTEDHGLLRSHARVMASVEAGVKRALLTFKSAVGSA
jgi:hypothetical protein